MWEYELKFDGYRALAVKHGGNVTLYSRNRKTFNKRFPGIVDRLVGLPDDTVIDGEVVALDESGPPAFNRLQNATAQTAVTFFACDLLIWRRQDLRERPLEERWEALKTEVVHSSFVALQDDKDPNKITLPS